MTSKTAIARYRAGDKEAELALVVDGQLYAWSAVFVSGAKIGQAKDIMSILADWEQLGPEFKTSLADGEKLVRSGKVKALDRGSARLLAPFRPERIFCAASNYIEHANEMGTVLAAKVESKPYMFLKLRNTVIGPDDEIRLPPETHQLDWEIELAAVIGRGGRRLKVDQALEHVAGYSILNDISARDLNVRDDYPFKFDWFQGKCHDTFAPFGPCIVPAWLIPDPQMVEMTLSVNGEQMQRDSTRNMIWTLREQIAYVSTIVTLEPGDVIATGTPTGVGMGRGIYLKAGDRVSATIDGIGTLNNQVITERL